jgi:hypothetical protein
MAAGVWGEGGGGHLQLPGPGAALLGHFSAASSHAAGHGQNQVAITQIYPLYILE